MILTVAAESVASVAGEAMTLVGPRQVGHSGEVGTVAGNAWQALIDV